eukprot:m.1094160 g.1094160  ORF g.1094160 m.1094160 type:complete len:52 (-) comp24300_c0_seq8:1471-1626(-)
MKLAGHKEKLVSLLLFTIALQQAPAVSIQIQHHGLIIWNNNVHGFHSWLVI